MTTTTRTRAPRPAGLPDPAAEPTIRVARGAQLLSLSLRATYKLCEHGEIPSIRVGGAIRILTQEFLDKYRLPQRNSNTGTAA